MTSPSQARDTVLGDFMGAARVDDHRGWVNAAHQVRSAGRGVVVGGVVERLDGDHQGRIGVGDPGYSFFIEAFANSEPEPTAW